MPRFLILPLAGLLLAGSALGTDLSFKVYSGAGYVDGGDLSRTISGWRSYYGQRQETGFSSSYNVGEMHGSLELGFEAIVSLSRRWSLGLEVGYVSQGTDGEVETRRTSREILTVSPTEQWTVDTERMTSQNPVYSKSTIPVILSLEYALAISDAWTLTLGAGGGVYFGRLGLEESYEVDSDTTSERPTESGLVRYIDRLVTSGEYSEETRSTGFGLHGRVGLDLRLSPSLRLSISVLGRSVNMENWKGTRRDASEWQWVYGLWGSQQAQGRDERTEDGQYWTSDLTDETSGRSFPVAVFRSAAPAPASKPANFNLSGVTVRVGLGFRFGGRD
jgi:hypothetical protein